LRGAIATWQSGRGDIKIATPTARNDTEFGLFEKVHIVIRGGNFMDDEIYKIHKASIKILEEVGFEVNKTEIIEVLNKNGIKIIFHSNPP
jgi:trimethylamine:corrinoid methyltransferase-like protein